MTDDKGFRGRIKDAEKELTSLAETLQLKIKLASMDAKDAGEKVAHEIAGLGRKIVEVGEAWRDTPALTDDERLQLHLMRMEIRERWAKVEPVLADIAQQGKDALNRLPVDAARLEAELLRMSAKDELDKRVAAARSEAKEAAKAVEETVDGVVARARELVKKLKG